MPTYTSTIFLRFPDEQTATDTLKSLDLWVESEDYSGPRPSATVRAIDIVGTIVRSADTGEVNEDGYPIIEQTTLPGYHINLLGELPNELAQYIVEPTNPQRVFFA